MEKVKRLEQMLISVDALFARQTLTPLTARYLQLSPPRRLPNPSAAGVACSLYTGLQNIVLASFPSAAPPILHASQSDTVLRDP